MIMVVRAVAVETVATYVAMVKEIVIRTANVPAVLLVDTIIVNNLEAVLITLMTAVYNNPRKTKIDRTINWVWCDMICIRINALINNQK